MLAGVRKASLITICRHTGS